MEMKTNADIREILVRLVKLQAEMENMKKCVAKIEDDMLTDDDLESLDLAEKDFKEGKTKRL